MFGIFPNFGGTYGDPHFFYGARGVLPVVGASDFTPLLAMVCAQQNSKMADYAILTPTLGGCCGPQ